MTDRGPIEASITDVYGHAPKPMLELALGMARQMDTEPQAAMAKRLHEVLRTLDGYVDSAAAAPSFVNYGLRLFRWGREPGGVASGCRRGAFPIELISQADSRISR